MDITRPTMLSLSAMKTQSIPYMDIPGCRILDLRPDGVECIPVLSLSDLKSLRASTKEHIHAGCLEVCLCQRGNLSFESGGKIYPFLPGTVFVSTPHQPHNLRSNPKGLKMCRILFTFAQPRQRLLGLDTRGSEWLSRSLAHLPQRTFAATSGIIQGFERLFDLYDHERPHSPARRVKLRSATLGLLIAVIEAARRIPIKPPNRIEAIAKRMRTSPQNTYPIAEIAAECALSRATFIESFKRMTGLPPHAYLMDCKVKAAEKMLRTTSRTIASIADELGFASNRHLASVFRHTTGQSPSAYRTDHFKLAQSDSVPISRQRAQR